ncbi:MAG: hypothetical protein Q6373_022570 [Candidatus Sigynarchaeota archaeon]
MKDAFKQFSPFFLIVFGQAFIFLLLLYVRFDGFAGIHFRGENVNLIRIISLIAGFCILLAIFLKLGLKYRKNPNATRLNILLAIASFMIACCGYLVASLWTNPDPAVGRFPYDVAVVFLILAAYMFLVFGITFLVVPSNERAVHGFKRTMDVLLIAMYLLFLVQKISRSLEFTETAFITFLMIAGEYFIMVFGVACILLMLVTAIKALVLAKRTKDATFKNGLNALGASYIFLFSSMLAFVMNMVVFEDDNVVDLVAIMLLVIGFYFVYAGFVKPTAPSNDAGSK